MVPAATSSPPRRPGRQSAHPIGPTTVVTPEMRKAAQEKGGTASATGRFDNWL